MRFTVGYGPRSFLSKKTKACVHLIMVKTKLSTEQWTWKMNSSRRICDNYRKNKLKHRKKSRWIATSERTANQVSSLAKDQGLSPGSVQGLCTWFSSPNPFNADNLTHFFCFLSLKYTNSRRHYPNSGIGKNSLHVVSFNLIKLILKKGKTFEIPLLLKLRSSK